MRSTVDLPEPDGPMSVTFSPVPTAKLKPSRTVSSPKRLVTSLKRMMGGVGHRRGIPLFGSALLQPVDEPAEQTRVRGGR